MGPVSHHVPIYSKKGASKGTYKVGGAVNHLERECMQGESGCREQQVVEFVGDGVFAGLAPGFAAFNQTQD